MVNTVMLLGRLTKNAEIRKLPSGHWAISFTVAVNKKYKTKDGSQKEDSYFFDVEKVVSSVNSIEKYLTKGTPVIIQGQLKQQRWTSKEGKNNSKIFVYANRIELLPKSKKQQPVIDENVDVEDEDVSL